MMLIIVCVCLCVIHKNKNQTRNKKSKFHKCVPLFSFLVSMTFESSSPVSVVLFDEGDFEEEVYAIESFDLKCFKDSQACAGVGVVVTPSQMDPLGEFSQVPNEVVLHEDDEDDEDEDDDDFLIRGSLFNNTQMTDLKDDDSDGCFSFTSSNSNSCDRESDALPTFGTDGYVRPSLPSLCGSTDPSAALDLIRSAKRIVVVSGAGISVSAGIPDFRSEGRGLYALLDSFMSGGGSGEASKLFGGLRGWQLEALRRLDEPESLFDLDFFMHDPHPFYAFMLATRFGAPSAVRFAPTPTHQILASLPNLLLAFTQNIDTLEAAANLAQVCYCHGSFESVSCVRCRRPHDVQAFWELLGIYSEAPPGNSALPLCQFCCEESEDEDGTNDSLPLLKPDIVFFGESLPVNFFAHIRSTLPMCDLLIVTGSSMKVLPVGSIPDLIPPSIPQILINKDPILDHNFDLKLLGEADCIWSWIARELNLKPELNVEAANFKIYVPSPGTFIFQ
jgi:NAD-dependent SIR2 family protein deacetylase